jgi:hypothetical protein
MPSVFLHFFAINNQIGRSSRSNCRVQSIAVTTHSLSIQPLLSADGTLHSPLLVCFQVTPPVGYDFLKGQLCEFTNLCCVQSTSGKFGKHQQEKWFRETFLPTASVGAVLILDKWSGYKSSIEMEVTRWKGIHIHTIPAGATGAEQPLEVNFNRQFKLHLHLQCEKIHHRRSFSYERPI